jgi:hypothetical protein
MYFVARLGPVLAMSTIDLRCVGISKGDWCLVVDPVDQHILLLFTGLSA